jgi:hypothetical protein
MTIAVLLRDRGARHKAGSDGRRVGGPSRHINARRVGPWEARHRGEGGPGRWRLRESVARCDDLRRQFRPAGGEAVAASAAAALALKNARLRGSLLDAEAVEREWSGHLERGSVRGAGDTVPHRGIIAASERTRSRPDRPELRAALTRLEQEGHNGSKGW